MMTNLNWVDYLLLAIFLFSTLAGFARGFVKEIVSLITLVAAFIIATMFAHPLAAAFTSASSVQEVVNSASNAMGVSTAQPVSYVAIAISFALLFAATILIGAIVGYLLNIAFQTGILGLGNRLLGALFGFCRGFIINLVIIFLVQLTSFSQATAWQESQVVIAFQPAVVWLGNIVSPSLANLKEKFGQTLQNMNSSVGGISDKVEGYLK